MISNKNVANAVAGKTARACDSCVRKRARWYCAADDAFLCQSCDSSVHSANPLARRHERVRLKISSLKSLDIISKGSSVITVPSWHQGFTRKARTPRNGHGNKPLLSLLKIEEKSRNPIPLVPEVGSDDQISHEDNNEEEQLLYRVPIFDPFVAELCTPTTISNEADQTTTAPFTAGGGNGNDTDQTVAGANGIESKASYLHGFLPSETDLADFAADVESLLGRGLENESFGMEDLGLVDCKEEKQFKMQEREFSLASGQVIKLEEEEKEEEEAVRECHIDTEIDMAKEPPFELSFDYDSATCGEEDEKVATPQRDIKSNNGEYKDNTRSKNDNKKKRKILLSLDYEAVITAWATQGTSPWTDGTRRDVDPDECWQDCMGTCGAEFHHPYGDTNGLGGVGGGGNPAMAGGGREARVSRYREKRRTRLFSKKIRYEVRKLNAEKRPRMKGRFVKRATFAGGPSAFPLHAK
ncbi:zinc finger protein CONSTANS-LIKE 6 [Ricinus communis]|uniref:Transcription factor n=1 Tax=Ricinus communis TaxID=3988 RepID=B9T059_RICCO|nr:zinc finger protein CONSTANS-LIKE 6 [Ricinus communis]EEF30756.1 conserved hypothetical protein [Ricinus communis]|eukprot:XP_002531628.1 zinc finger protein CONSTANS-LIKE 6 [Ricinus communis]